MFRRPLVFFAAVLLSLVNVGAASTPDAENIIKRVIDAAGGPEAFAGIGVLEMAVSQEETHSDGTSTKREYTVFVDTTDLGNLRLELPDGVVVGANGPDGWATKNGDLDERPQTSYMARGTLNQTVFPLLLPFSLEMSGVWAKDVVEIDWEGSEAWALILPFAKGFFASPAMTTTWRVVVAKDDASILAVDFLPPVEYQKVQMEGIRYRFLKSERVNGATIPTQILLDGITLQGVENGHVRVTKIELKARGPWDPTLFLNPQKLEELEQLDEE